MTDIVNTEAYQYSIDDDIYTIRKDAYKKGKKDYLTGEYNPPTNYESEIHYQCGWASAEWETKHLETISI